MKRSHRYQLVLQFPAESLDDYDTMIELENGIIAGIGNLGMVDGHDMGCGESNIFIHTDEPKLTFEGIKHLLESRGLLPWVKVAYRKFHEDDYAIIFPPGLEHFAVS